MNSFDKVAPYLSDPLILAGFTVFLFFGLCRYLLKRGIIPPLGKTQGFRIVRLILLYGFALGLVISALGFGLKYRSLSEAEQRRAVAVLQAELAANSALLSQLAANLETMVGIYQAITIELRDEELVLLRVLFPMENLRSDLGDPTPRELALAALQQVRSLRLDRDKSELRKTQAVGNVIVATIDRTLATVYSLADKEHQRYVIRRAGYETHLPLLRRIETIDTTDLPQAYAELDQVRANYDVVVANLVAYLSSTQEFFRNAKVNDTALTEVLTAERLVTVMLVEFTSALVDAAESFRQREKQLQSAT